MPSSAPQHPTKGLRTTLDDENSAATRTRSAPVRCNPGSGLHSITAWQTRFKQ